MIAAIGPTLGVAALLVLSGAGWLALFRARSLVGPERWALAFAAGASWLGLLTAVLAPLPLFRPIVVVPLLLAPTLALFRRREPGGDVARAQGLRAWIGLAPALPLVALSLWLAVQRPVWSIDAQRRWVLHAQWTADEHTATPERIEDRRWNDAHPSYPPLVSAVLALALQLGADRDEGMRVTFPLYFFALIAVVHGFARRRAPPLVATTVALVLATVPCLAVLDAQKGSYGLGADSALADIPLAMFLTALSALVLDALAVGGERARPRWSLAILVGAGAVLTKNEGLVFAPLTAAIALAASCLARRGTALAEARGALGRLLGVTVAAGVLWKIVARDMPVREGERYLSSDVLADLAGGLDRGAAIAGRMFEELSDAGLWGALWVWPLVWMIWYAARFAGWDATERLRRALPFLWLVAGLVMVFGAYLATGWKSGSWLRLMDVSLARLLIHHAPLVLLLACDLFERPPARAAALTPAETGQPERSAA